MSVLLLRVEGPQQSFGSRGLFGIRDTNREPTKSFLGGIIRAAFGIDRNDNSRIKEINSLKFGVRIDCEGIVMCDYQTSGGGQLPMDYNTANECIKKDKYFVPKASRKINKHSVVTHKYFLADASFIMGVETNNNKLLEEYQKAIQNPKWALYLGRKAYFPSSPLLIGIINNSDLETVLRTYCWNPWAFTDYNPPKPERLRILMEDNDGVEYIYDNPLSYAINNRKYKKRYCKTSFVYTKDLEE